MATQKQRKDQYRKATAIQRFARPVTTGFVLGFGEDGKVTEDRLHLLTPIPRSRVSRESLIVEGVPAEAWQVPAHEASKASARGEAVVESDRESMRIFIRNLYDRFGEGKDLPGSVTVFVWEGRIYICLTR